MEPHKTGEIQYHGWVHSVAFSPDGTKLVTILDNTVLIWDVETGSTYFGKVLHELVGHKMRVYSAEFSPDGKKLVTSCDDQTVRIWDWERCPPPYVPPKVRDF
jgi:WD40 repeat protein